MSNVKTRDAGLAGFISMKTVEDETAFMGYLGGVWCFESSKSLGEWEREYMNSEFPTHNDATVRMLRMKSMSVG